MGRSAQSEVEEMVYDAVFEVSDEFDLKVDRLPEVYYVYPGFSFDKIGCPTWRWADFKGDDGQVSINSKIVFIVDRDIDTVFEEAGHFLHFNNSKLKFTKQNVDETREILTISEILGYFSSKLVNSSRRPLYLNYPDAINEESKLIKRVEREGLDFDEVYIYQQGYGLGEKLFDAYISGIVSGDFVRSLFVKNFNRKGIATSTFLSLRDFLGKDI
jgi:hypothetical protein